MDGVSTAHQEATGLHKLPSILHPSDNTDLTVSARYRHIHLDILVSRFSRWQGKAITTHRVGGISLTRRTAMEHLEGTLQTLQPSNRHCVGMKPNAKAGRQLS